MRRLRRSTAAIAIAALCAAAAFVADAQNGVSVLTLSLALKDPDRPVADRDRDAGRRPAEVVAFLGIRPGETVVDLIAAGGYYTEVLSLAVGPKGKVYAQNNEFVLKLRDGANEKAMSARLAGDRLSNVERLDREMSDLGLAPGSIDAAVTALNFHDIYNSNGPEAAAGFLSTVYALLKSGGVLGVIDHSGFQGLENDKLHRIEEKLAVDAARKAGFEVEATSDLLRNPKDLRVLNVFAAEIRGHTDRFVLRLRKPSGPAAAAPPHSVAHAARS